MGEWLLNANTKAEKSNKAEIRGGRSYTCPFAYVDCNGKVDGNGYKFTEAVTSKGLQSGGRCGRIFI